MILNNYKDQSIESPQAHLLWISIPAKMPGDDSALGYLQTPQMPTHILQGQTQHNTLQMSSVLKLNFVLYKCYLFNGVPRPPWLLLQVKPETLM